MPVYDVFHEREERPESFSQKDLRAFLKKLGSEPYPLTEKQKELIKFIEENPNIKLTISGLLKPGSNPSVKILQGRSSKPPQIFYDETESDLYDAKTGEPIDLERSRDSTVVGRTEARHRSKR